jgi:hypothetical protein
MAEGDVADRRPAATEGLELNETDDGLVVYDEATDRVHHLNQTAAVVLSLCDGTRTEAEIAFTLGKLFGLPEVPEAQTQACILQLKGDGLVT